MPPYIWMPPVHKQHKESILCQTKGVSICPHTFGCPICLDAPAVCLNAPKCLDGFLYVWMPPYVWTPPVCLDTPHVWMPTCMFGHPPMFALPDMFGCLPVCLDAP